MDLKLVYADPRWVDPVSQFDLLDRVAGENVSKSFVPGLLHMTNRIC